MTKEFVEGKNVRLQAARLRVVMALRRDRREPMDVVVERVARDTGVGHDLFRAFLLEQGGAVASAILRREVELKAQQVASERCEEPLPARREAAAQAAILGLTLDAAPEVAYAASRVRKIRSPVA